jgi:hypothetical protein
MGADAATQQPVRDLLTGNNPKNKVYLQIPEKSRPADKTMVFNDPGASRTTSAWTGTWTAQ